MSSFYEKVAMMAAVAGSMEIDKGGDMSLVFEKVVSDKRKGQVFSYDDHREKKHYVVMKNDDNKAVVAAFYRAEFTNAFHHQGFGFIFGNLWFGHAELLFKPDPGIHYSVSHIRYDISKQLYNTSNYQKSHGNGIIPR